MKILSDKEYNKLISRISELEQSKTQQISNLTLAKEMYSKLKEENFYLKSGIYNKVLYYISQTCSKNECKDCEFCIKNRKQCMFDSQPKDLKFFLKGDYKEEQ